MMDSMKKFIEPPLKKRVTYDIIYQLCTYCPVAGKTIEWNDRK